MATCSAGSAGWPAEPDLQRLERRLRRAGFARIAGADEAGRGACAGPLVVAACVLPTGQRGTVPGLADSKLLSPVVRERVYDEVVARAVSYRIVVVSAAEIDRVGLHVANVTGMRRALAQLDPEPSFCLTDGFAVRGLGRPGVAIWKGDRVAACVAAASVLAKVTRDRMLVQLDAAFPGYGFADHKGYVTATHARALAHHGPCPEHRRSYVNVRRAEQVREDVVMAERLRA